MLGLLEISNLSNMNIDENILDDLLKEPQGQISGWHPLIHYHMTYHYSTKA